MEFHLLKIFSPREALTSKFGSKIAEAETEMAKREIKRRRIFREINSWESFAWFYCKNELIINWNTVRGVSNWWNQDHCFLIWINYPTYFGDNSTCKENAAISLSSEANLLVLSPNKVKNQQLIILKELQYHLLPSDAIFPGHEKHWPGKSRSHLLESRWHLPT